MHYTGVGGLQHKLPHPNPGRSSSPGPNPITPRISCSLANIPHHISSHRIHIANQPPAAAYVQTQQGKLCHVDGSFRRAGSSTQQQRRQIKYTRPVRFTYVTPTEAVLNSREAYDPSRRTTLATRNIAAQGPVCINFYRNALHVQVLAVYQNMWPECSPLRCKWAQ